MPTPIFPTALILKSSTISNRKIFNRLEFWREWLWEKDFSNYPRFAIIQWNDTFSFLKRRKERRRRINNIIESYLLEKIILSSHYIPTIDWNQYIRKCFCLWLVFGLLICFVLFSSEQPYSKCLSLPPLWYMI